MNGRWLVWVLLPILGLGLVLEVEHAVGRWRASQVFVAVKTITIEASTRGRLTRQLLERNLSLLRRAEPWSPVEVALPIARGGQYYLLERQKAAIRAYQEALALEPRGDVYAHLGRAYLRAGDRPAADRAFRTAILLDHNQHRQLEGFLLGAE